MFIVRDFNVQIIIHLTLSVPRRLHIRCTHSYKWGFTFYSHLHKFQVQQLDMSHYCMFQIH